MLNGTKSTFGLSSEQKLDVNDYRYSCRQKKIQLKRDVIIEEEVKQKEIPLEMPSPEYNEPFFGIFH